jgi:hypothetical protein
MLVLRRVIDYSLVHFRKMSDLPSKMDERNDLFLGQFRLLVKTQGIVDEPVLRHTADGFELHFSYRNRVGRSGRVSGVLLAEKTREPRVFAKAETALRLLWSLGFLLARVENFHEKDRWK